MASGSGKASMSVVTAEALIKDQAGGGLRRWSYAFGRSAQPQRAGSGAAAGNGGGSTCGRSDASARALPSSDGRGGAVVAAARRRKAKQQEEELRTVMYLSNWGPNN